MEGLEMRSMVACYDVEATEKERKHGVSPSSQRILIQIGLK